MSESKQHYPLLISAKKAAEMMGVSRAHFYRMHNAGRIPLPLRLGGAVRWRVNELQEWVEAGMPSRREWLKKGGRI